MLRIAEPIRITARDVLSFMLVAPVMVAWFIWNRIGGKMKPDFPLPWIVARGVVNLVRPRAHGQLTEFAADSGRCWIVRVSRWIPDDFTGQSTVTLTEDGRPLGPAHCLHDDIRTLGGGRYSHWGPYLYFSTSDGSDPRSNGRRYAFEERSAAEARREASREAA